MKVGIQEEISHLHALGLLEKLLADKTTGGHILWATDAYQSLGEEYLPDREIQVDLITGKNSSVIQTRAQKELCTQAERTRQHGEVFTPLEIVAQMVDALDTDWFGTPDSFAGKHVVFPEERNWRDYISSTRMEITCGEAPFLVSRYDVTTGEQVADLRNRTGLLDRKLRVIGEHTRSENGWITQVVQAYQSTYGYEFQGDNLLIARINLLATFEDYLMERWKRKPTIEEYDFIIDIITWNLWQMDGLTNMIPFAEQETAPGQYSLFDMPMEDDSTPIITICRIYDWNRKCSIEYRTMQERRPNIMKFKFVVGNPPYQEEAEGDNKTFAAPIYDKFLDATYEVSDKVELIHPARFLFNAGSTSKAWNEKMLNDPHLKVILYEPDSSKVFTNTSIMGGIAITYHDNERKFEPIQVFSAFNEMNTIRAKVNVKNEQESLTSLIFNQTCFDLDSLYRKHPEYTSVIGSNGKDRRFRNNIFEKIPLFTLEKTKDDDLPIIGVVKNKRAWRFFPKEFCDMGHENISKWKILVPAANGSGAIGEVVPTPLIGEPLLTEPMSGYTQTFIGVGAFNTKNEAEATLKYVKTKFVRTMLGILKITQHNPASVWRFVPLQDFTSSSDIDWAQSISDIDQQLYAKYGLDENEIAFIESHVKEMD